MGQRNPIKHKPKPKPSSATEDHQPTPPPQESYDRPSPINITPTAAPYVSSLDAPPPDYSQFEGPIEAPVPTVEHAEHQFRGHGADVHIEHMMLGALCFEAENRSCIEIQSPDHLTSPAESVESRGRTIISVASEEGDASMDVDLTAKSQFIRPNKKYEGPSQERTLRARIGCSLYHLAAEEMDPTPLYDAHTFSECASGSNVSQSHDEGGMKAPKTAAPLSLAEQYTMWRLRDRYYTWQRLDSNPILFDLILLHRSITEPLILLRKKVKDSIDAELEREGPLKELAKDLEKIPKYYSILQGKVDYALSKIVIRLGLNQFPTIDDKAIIGGLNARLYCLLSLLNTARAADPSELPDGTYQACLDIFTQVVETL